MGPVFCTTFVTSSCILTEWLFRLHSRLLCASRDIRHQRRTIDLANKQKRRFQASLSADRDWQLFTAGAQHAEHPKENQRYKSINFVICNCSEQRCLLLHKGCFLAYNLSMGSVHVDHCREGCSQPEKHVMIVAIPSHDCDQIVHKIIIALWCQVILPRFSLP